MVEQQTLTKSHKKLFEKEDSERVCANVQSILQQGMKLHLPLAWMEHTSEDFSS